ncbi:hypothetical protein STTU_3763 [Streptomyces sp. Tu6071]|nr:hypothetical protein STTU_3763 [Streptomyces sp. Tu6071]
MREGDVRASPGRPVRPVRRRVAGRVRGVAEGARTGEWGTSVWAPGRGEGSVHSAPTAVTPGRAPFRDPSEWMAEAHPGPEPTGYGRRRGPLVRSVRTPDRVRAPPERAHS